MRPYRLQFQYEPGPKWYEVGEYRTKEAAFSAARKAAKDVERIYRIVKVKLELNTNDAS